jgi:hypothetical protein
MRNKTHPYVPYFVWLAEKCDTNGDNLVHEVTAEFPRAEINRLFQHQYTQALSRLMGQHMHQGDDGYHHLRQSHDALQDFDWVGFISASLRNAGIPPQDLDAATSGVVAQLLVRPGKLFGGWDGVAPLEARFKKSVRNAVINAGVKAQKARRRKVLSFSEPGVEAAGKPQHSDDVVKQFVGHVGLRLGGKAKRLLQHLLDGGEIKDLVGVDGATSYQLKEMKKALKRELLSFGANDPDFLSKVKTALTQDEETLNRRFGANRRQLSGS